jgi:hypothetical protein
VVPPTGSRLYRGLAARLRRISDISRKIHIQYFHAGIHGNLLKNSNLPVGFFTYLKF